MMLDIMTNAGNAIEALNVALTATSSNIANMNVTGYKRVEVSFQSIFEKMLSMGTAAKGDLGGTNPYQLGQGMGISSIGLDTSQGEFSQAKSIDLAINGQGYFILSDGVNYRYTRAGNFSIDSSGNLISNGMVVYGLDASSNLVPITGLSGSTSSYSWQSDGTLLNNNVSTGYKIALTYFTNPAGLLQTQGTSFAATVASGSAASASAPGATAGTIMSGYIESSNVDYLSESLEALEIQRAMNANLTMVQLASEMISSFISKLS